MITLVNRSQIIEGHQVIASELAKMQHAFFDEEALELYREDKEEQTYLERFDCLDKQPLKYQTFSKVIGLHYTDLGSFTNVLSAKLQELFYEVDTEQIFVLSHLKLNFFGNRGNAYTPLVNAYTKLEYITGATAYSEAFVVGLNDLPAMVEVLFWLTRCDPSVAEYIFLFDKEQKVQICICKYGNVHLTEFKNERLTNGLLTDKGWRIIEGEEFDNFSEGGAIDGRVLKM